MTAGPMRIDVVVPVRDEAERIERCLDALQDAASTLHATGSRTEIGIVLVLDHCEDTTASLVDAHPWRASVTVVHAVAHGVGAARELGSRTALRRTRAHLDRRWLAHTDGDSRVGRGWLLQHDAALRSGAHVLVGAVVPDPDDLDVDVLERWRTAHPPGATLGHVHGANLGTRADAFEAIGGFSAVPEHEDVLLVERARVIGLRIDTTTEVPVTTSGRFVGRTPGGYAEHLRGTYGRATRDIGAS